MNRRLWILPILSILSASAVFAAGEFTEVFRVFGDFIGDIFSGDWIAGNEAAFFRFLIWLVVFVLVYNILKTKVFANFGDSSPKMSTVVGIVFATATALFTPIQSAASILGFSIVFLALLGAFIALYRPDFMKDHPVGKNVIRLFFLSFMLIFLTSYRAYFSNFFNSQNPIANALSFALSVLLIVVLIAWIMALFSMFSNIATTKVDGSLKGSEPGSLGDIATKAGKVAGPAIWKATKGGAKWLGDKIKSLFSKIFDIARRRSYAREIEEAQRALAEKERELQRSSEQLERLRAELEALRVRTNTSTPDPASLEAQRQKEREIQEAITRLNNIITELERIGDLENNVERQLNELNFHEAENARAYLNSCISKQQELRALTQTAIDDVVRSKLLEYELELSPQMHELNTSFIDLEKTIRAHSQMHDRRLQIINQIKIASTALKKIDKSNTKEYAELLAQRKLLQKERDSLNIRSINAKLTTAVDTFIHYGGNVYETLSKAGQLLGEKIPAPTQHNQSAQSSNSQNPQTQSANSTQGHTPSGRYKLIAPDKSFPAFLTTPQYLLNKLDTIQNEIIRVPLSADPKNQDPQFTSIIRNVSTVIDEFKDNFGFVQLRLANKITKSHERLFTHIQNFNKNVIMSPNNLFLLWQDTAKVIHGQTPSQITVKGMSKEDAAKIVALFEAEKKNFEDELRKVEHALSFI